jgi:hypothetical protein
MSPLWEIEYRQEVINYFVENGDFTGNLLGEIERLRYSPDGLPESNYTNFAPDLIQWEVLGHLVYYRRQDNTILVAVVKPAADKI